MSTIKSFSDCEFRRYCKGYKIGNDPSYPTMAWGHYLPGDEPGYYCSETDGGCDPDGEIKLVDCYRMKLTNKRHPSLELEDVTSDFPIWKDQETGNLFYVEETQWLTEREFQMAQIDRIKELLQNRIDEYKESIANGSFSKESAIQCLQEDLSLIEVEIGNAYSQIKDLIAVKVNSDVK